MGVQVARASGLRQRGGFPRDAAGHLWSGGHGPVRPADGPAALRRVASTVRCRGARAIVSGGRPDRQRVGRHTVVPIRSLAYPAACSTPAMNASTNAFASSAHSARARSSENESRTHVSMSSAEWSAAKMLRNVRSASSASGGASADVAGESRSSNPVVARYRTRTRITFRSYSASICSVISTPPAA